MHVHIVTAANRALYVRELEAMHRHRHEVFADYMGWTALKSPDGLDLDEFDTPHTVYFLVLDDNGVLRGSDRVNPSWRPHMLANLFPEFATQPIPKGPGVWEWSRHAPGHPRWSESLNRRIRILSSIALLEFALSRGVEGFTGILESRAIPMAVKVGWKPRPLGLPVNYGEGEGVACYCPADTSLLPRLRRIAQRDDAIVVELPAGLKARRPVELALRLSASHADAAAEVIAPMLTQSNA